MVYSDYNKGSDGRNLLTYGSEVVVPVKVAIHTHYIITFQEELNNVALRDSLDMLPLSVVTPTYV